MELRIKKLEEFAETAKEEFRSIDVRLGKIEVRLQEISSTMATKAELADLKSEMIKWIVGTMLAGGAVAISVMTFVLNHAVSKPAVLAPQQAPIYISVPQFQPPPAAEPTK